MKIRTRLYLGLAPSLIVLMGMGLALAWTQGAMNEATRTASMAQQIMRSVLDVSELRNEYVLGQDPRTLEQWQSRHDALRKLASNARLTDPAERHILAQIDQLNAEVEPLFEELVQLQARADDGASDTVQRQASRRRIVEQLAARSRQRAAHALQLASLAHNRITNWQSWSRRFVLVAAALTAALIVGNSWFVLRGVLRPVATLQAGVNVVGSGDLEHRVATGARDELGELARAFDDMTRNLQSRDNELEESLHRERIRARQLRGLAQTAIAVNSARSLEEVLQFVTEQARSLIGAHQAVTSFTVDRNWAQAITGLSLSDKYAVYRSYDAKPDGTGIYALVCETNRPLRMTQAELEAHPRWRGFGTDAARHPAMRGWLAVPLVGRDEKNLGLVQLSDKEEGEFTAEDEAVIVQLAQMASGALEIRRFHETLEERVASRTSELAARTQEWQREQFLLNSLVENIPDPVFFKDRQGRFLRVNRIMAVDAGFEDPQDMIGKTDADVWPDTMAAETAVDEAAILETGQPLINKEENPVNRDGVSRWVLVTKMPLRDELGAIVGSFGIARDVTERKKRQQEIEQLNAALLHSNAELEQFAYIASHDLQEPLRKIQAFGNLLVTRFGDSLGGDGQDYVQRMQRSAQRMQALINELLVLSRINRRGEPFVRVDLGQVVRDMLQDLDERIAQSRAEVRIDDLPSIDADPTQMRQLFQNLIANALKFRRSDQPPRVLVRGRMPKARQDGAALGRQSCEIEVVDNCIGFEQRYAEQIFQPFQRLHGRSEYEGTGMGLTICRKIAERHGGTIVARGVPGEGSTFLVTLPLTQSTGGPSDGQRR